MIQKSRKKYKFTISKFTHSSMVQFLQKRAKNIRSLIKKIIAKIVTFTIDRLSFCTFIVHRYSICTVMQNVYNAAKNKNDHCDEHICENARQTWHIKEGFTCLHILQLTKFLLWFYLKLKVLISRLMSFEIPEYFIRNHVT